MIRRFEKQDNFRKSPYDDNNVANKQLLRTPSRDYLGSGSPKRTDALNVMSAVPRDRTDALNGSSNGATLWHGSTDQTKSRQYQLEDGQEAGNIPDPPLEYSEQIPRRVLSESNGDLKRGILGSIIDKVRSKEDPGNTHF